MRCGLWFIPQEKLMASHGSSAASPWDKEAQRDLSVDLYLQVTVLCMQSPQLSCSWGEQTGSALLWKENDSAEVFPPPFSGGRRSTEERGGSQGDQTAYTKEESGIVGWIILLNGLSQLCCWSVGNRASLSPGTA